MSLSFDSMEDVSGLHLDDASLRLNLESCSSPSFKDRNETIFTAKPMHSKPADAQEST